MKEHIILGSQKSPPLYCILTVPVPSLDKGGGRS